MKPVDHCNKDKKQRDTFNKKFLLLTAFLLAVVLGIVYILLVTNPYKDRVEGEGEYGFAGSGTQSDPFLISDLDDLCHFRDLVNSGISFSGFYFLQTADIDMLGTDNWTPIGEFGSGCYFYGGYNGGGHTLSNLKILGPNNNNGLFGVLYGEVRNLGIESGYIEGAYIGAIASHGVASATILNCYNKATLHGLHRAGGIADNFIGRISYCWNFGEVTCDSGVAAGISSYGAQIMNCYSYQVPVIPDDFFGTAVDVGQFDTFDEVDTWLNQIYDMLYEDKLGRDAGGGTSGQLCLLVRDGNTVSFSKSYSVAVTTKKNIESFLVDHAAILLLAAAALVMIVIAIRRPAALGGVLTTFLVCAGLWLFNGTLVQKTSDGFSPMNYFYSQPNNTIDVLLLGSSRAGMNQDCEELWTDFGISSYALWGSVQPAWNSYYYLNEALKYGVPKVVVFDVCGVARDHYAANVQYMQYANTSGMKLSLNKFSAIQASASQERWTNLLLGFPIYHTRYFELTKIDFGEPLWGGLEGGFYKGYIARYGTGKLSGFGDIPDAEEVAQISAKQEEFLLKLISRCKTEDIPLLLVASVMPKREKEMLLYNYIAELAAQYDVPFVDFNRMDEETGITVKDVYLDNSHLNTNGARKQSAYLGQYLKENYDLIDHRGDPRYNSWDEYAVQLQNTYITMITDLSDYLKELVRDDRTVLVIKYSPIVNVLLEELQQSAADAGFDMGFLNQSGNGCWVIEHPGNSSENTYYELNQDIAFQLGDEDFSIAPFSDGAITYAGRMLSKVQTGIICVVYDTNTKEVIHTRKIL